MHAYGRAWLPRFSLFAIGLAVLVTGATLALCLPRADASVPGDEDTTFGVQGGVFSSIAPDLVRPDVFAEQDSDGTIVVASQVAHSPPNPQDPQTYPIDLARFTASGAPTGFGGDGREQTAPLGSIPFGIEDLRIIHDEGGDDDGTIVMAVNSPSHKGYLQSVDSDGGGQTQQTGIAPATCADAEMTSARVESTTTMVGGFDCTDTSSIVVRWTSGVPTRAIGDVSSVIHGIQDVELGPGNTIYVLGKDAVTDDASVVMRLKPVEGDPLTLTPDDTYGTDGVVHVAGAPVDMVVDTDGRAYAWTNAGAGVTTWDFYRLTANGAPDATWGNGNGPTAGRARVTNPGLTTAAAPAAKLMIGADGQLYAKGIESPSHVTPLALLTLNGALDPTWGAGGVKQLQAGTSGLFYEPVIQSDGKVLVPFSATGPMTMASRGLSTPPPGPSIGVARLQLVGTETFSNDDFGGSSNQGGKQGGSTSSTCGRRSISLVRAIPRGRKVELQGLVGAAYYGKSVTLYASTGRGYRKVKTTKATRIGTFSVRARKPRGRRLARTRYIAKAGSSRSAPVKVPQSLRSTSIRESGGKITVKGRIKRALVGHRRSRVKIQRLVCGHYKTVGSARSSRRGRYTVTFDRPRLGGVAYFRARAVVLNKPHGHYVVQYARAVRIRLSGQTG